MNICHKRCSGSPLFYTWKMGNFLKLIFLGVDFGFSREGRRTFFRWTKLIFLALLNLYKDHILFKFSAPQKKQALKIVYIGAKGAFRETYGGGGGQSKLGDVE